MIENPTRGLDVKALSLISEFDVKDVALQSFGFMEQVKSYPTFVLNLAIRNSKISKRFLDTAYFKISSLTPDVKINTDLCVTAVDIVQRDVYQLRGYCCHPDQILKYYTRYLGGTQKQIFLNLSKDKKVYSKTNIMSKYWQINSNNLNTLIAVCKAFSDYAYWSITLDTINLSVQPKINDYMDLTETDDSTVTLLREKKVKTENNVCVGIKYVLGNKDQSSILTNYTRNYTDDKISRPKAITNGSYTLAYPFKCGQRMKNTMLDLNLKFWEVHMCNYVFTENTCSTRVQLAGF